MHNVGVTPALKLGWCVATLATPARAGACVWGVAVMASCVVRVASSLLHCQVCTQQLCKTPRNECRYARRALLGERERHAEGGRGARGVAWLGQLCCVHPILPHFALSALPSGRGPDMVTRL